MPTIHTIERTAYVMRSINISQECLLRGVSLESVLLLSKDSRADDLVRVGIARIELEIFDERPGMTAADIRSAIEANRQQAAIRDLELHQQLRKAEET